MNDTSPEMEQLWRSRIMGKSAEERFKMGLSMSDLARKIVLSSLEGITDPVEKKIQLFRRFYSADLSEKQLVPIFDWIRRCC